MKLQIIETPDYILAVSDEEIKENDYFHLDMSDNNRPDEIHQMGNNKWSKTGGINFSQSSAWTRCCKKIIAYAPKNNASELDLPLLPEMVVEDDANKLPDFLYKNQYGCILSGVHGDSDVTNEWNNYKAETKKYSEEDILGAMEIGFELGRNFNDDDPNIGLGWLIHQKDNYIQSLKQPTPKCFVAEMQTTKSEVFRENDNAPYAVLKTTTNNGKTYLVGTYLYE
jgi:hypothetical protein